MATTTDTSRTLTPDGAVGVSKEEKGTAVPSDTPDQREEALPSTTRVILLAACLTFANIVYSFGGTGVTVLLDDIAASLDVAENNLQWIFNCVQLPFGCLILVAGRGADIWGRKRLFNIGIVMVAVWTLIAGFMKNEIAFYICRAMSGIASALVASSNIGILAENTAPGRLRSLSIGMCIAGLPFGGALGFTIAGPMAEGLGWRSVFYLQAGLNLIPFLGVFFLAKHRTETGEQTDRRIDWVGGLLFTAGSVLLFFCLSQALAGPKGWGTAYIIALLVISFALLAAAVIWVHYLERKTTYPPIMRISIVTADHYRVAVVYFVSFACIASYAGLLYSANIFYQRYEDMTATELMLRYLPGPIVGTFCNVCVGILASKLAGFWFFVVGALATGTANVLYAAMDEKATYWTFQFFAQALCVIGPDLTVAMGYIYITSVVNLSEVAVAGASLQFFVALGFVCGPSLSTLVYTSLINQRHGGALTQDESIKNPDLLSALRASWWFWAALCFAGLLLTLLFLRKMGKMGDGKPVEKDETSISTTGEKSSQNGRKVFTASESVVDEQAKPGGRWADHL